MQCSSVRQLLKMSKTAQPISILMDYMRVMVYHIQIMLHGGQSIEIDRLVVAICIGQNSLSRSCKKSTQAMYPSKTKVISKPIGFGELRELARKKLRSVEKARQANIKELLRVVDVECTECMICYCPLVQPVTLHCGHTCCLECLEEGSLTSGRCSFCKETIAIKEIIINRAIQRFVRRSLTLLGPHHRRNYKQRQLQIAEREKSRLVNVSNLQVGDQIDYRDSERLRWFKGSVMEIEKGKEKEKVLIYVEFAGEHQSSQDFDIFQSYSMSLAPAGFFSHRMVSSRPKPPRVAHRLSPSNRIKLSPNMHHLHPLLNAP